MIYDRKLAKVIKSPIDMDLVSSEYRVEVYDEILLYLSDNNCIEGMNLVNKRKMQMANYVNSIKNDLVEINNICDEIEIFIKGLCKQKNIIPSIIDINNKKIYVSEIGKNYIFIYPIGPDEFTKLYKYGIIETEINNGKLYKREKEIGFSSENNLVDYVGFKKYFSESVKEFNYANNLADLEFLKNKINYDLSRLFDTEDLKKYLALNSEDVKNSTGISGLEIMRTLSNSYDINRVKIKLISNGYSIDDKFVDVVRTKLNCNKISNYLKNTAEIEYEEIKDIYIKTLEEENDRVNHLLKELNMSSAELETAVIKVNYEFN